MSKESKELASHWKTQVLQVEAEYQRWYQRGKRVSQRYRDEREKIDEERRHFNLFWSNVETLKPALYARAPVPICERRFLDKDTTGRVAATILERALRYEVAMSGYDNSIRRALSDYLVVGRGQVWVRYNPKFGESISPEVKPEVDIIGEGDREPLEAEKEEEVKQSQRQLLSESLYVDYVHWQDFYQFPAHVRTEEEIEGKGRRLYMSRQDLVDRFGEKGRKVSLDHVPEALPDEGSRAIIASHEAAQATIYEIWWKPTRSVYFIAKEGDDILEETDDPLLLETFFPCPPALHTTTTNDTMIPVPDYVESQDQYIQIDELTKRIDVLSGALKVRGAYDASQTSLKRIFEEGDEPQLIPVDSWAMFAEKGGIQGAISLVPLKDISDTLTQIIEVRKELVQDLDRVTGIWDIMRGVSDARETLGAQRLKSNYGNTRLQARQDQVARFCREILCIMGEIVSEHYDDQTLINVSGALFDEGLEVPMPQMQPQPQLMPPQQPQMPLGANPQGGGVPSLPPPAGSMQPMLQQALKFIGIQKAIGLLRQDKLRGFRIDVETDSTIQGDMEQEKELRIQFVQGVTQFIEMAGQVAAGVPTFAPLAGKMLQFAVRGFRVGRDLESAIDEFCDKAEQQAKMQAAQQQPNPDLIKAQTEQMKAQAEIERQKVENQGEERNALIDFHSKQIDERMREMEVKMKEMELQGKMMELEAKKAEIGANIHLKDKDMHLKDKDLQIKGLEVQKHHREVGMRTMKELKEGKGDGEVDPNIAMMHEAAKIFDLASKRNAAPKEIVRDHKGKASHIVTHFKES